MPDVVLITPTRDRPECFRLAERWIARQTQSDFTWVVVDDGDVPVVPTMGQIHVRRQPSEKACTLPENVLAGLDMAENLCAKIILMIEDDDWYAPRYVKEMTAATRRARVTGEMRRRIYHVPTRGVLSSYERKHAALAATAIRHDAFDMLRRACERAIHARSPYVDMFLWGVHDQLEPRWKRVLDNQSGRGKVLMAQRRLSIGLKGMPGRGGLGQGHDPKVYPEHDYSGSMLRRWVGPGDAQEILALCPIPTEATT